MCLRENTKKSKDNTFLVCFSVFHVFLRVFWGYCLCLLSSDLLRSLFLLIHSFIFRYPDIRYLCLNVFDVQKLEIAV